MRPCRTHNMSMKTVSLEAVRRLAVERQGLAKKPRRTTKASLMEAIASIGLVQIDAIHVVARSQYLVLWSRLGTYPTRWLDESLHPDRRLFEYWAHAACLIPMDDLPYFVPVIRDHGSRPHRKLHRLGRNPEAVLADVKRRVSEAGVVTSRSFDDPRANRGTWWDWKPAKIALEILFDQGWLAVNRRVNFHREYTAAERVYGKASLTRGGHCTTGLGGQLDGRFGCSVSGRLGTSLTTIGRQRTMCSRRSPKVRSPAKYSA